MKNANEDALMGMVEPHDEPVLEYLKEGLSLFHFTFISQICFKRANCRRKGTPDAMSLCFADKSLPDLLDFLSS